MPARNPAATLRAPMEFPSEVPRLETPHLILRGPAETDAPGILAIFGDPGTMRYWSRPPMQTLDEAKSRLERVLRVFQSREAVPWILERRDTGELVGTCDLFRLDSQNLRCECGYSLASSAWGRGWMRHALGTAIAWGFAHLPLERIEADTDPRNTASIRLLKRLGFRLEGTLRERWRVAGEVSDSAMYGLLRREWGAQNCSAE